MKARSGPLGAAPGAQSAKINADTNVSETVGQLPEAESSAYETVIDALAELGRVCRSGDSRATSRCPAHDDRNPSLSVRYTHGRVLIYCHAGCDARDVVAQLDLTMGDLFDEKGMRAWKPDPEEQARYARRRTMTRVEKALDDLLHLPDFAQRLCQIIGRRRPELYLQEKRELGAGSNEALLSDPGFKWVAHLLGGAS